MSVVESPARTTTPTITEYVVPQKQAAKRHYGSHQYFTKRAWNVIQTYIKQFTKGGDTVCDPFGGSATDQGGFDRSDCYSVAST